MCWAPSRPGQPGSCSRAPRRSGSSRRCAPCTRRLLTAARTGHVRGARAREGAGRHASEDSVEAVRAAEASQQVAGLTQREREILALIALGLTNQEICDRLWLSMPTVKTHVSHLLAKTGARDRVQLVLVALRTGVVTLDDVLARP